MTYSDFAPDGQGWDIRMMWTDVETCLPSDFNCDGLVDGLDLSRLLGFWGSPETDIDGDGTTDGNDLAILLGDWSN